MKNAWIADFECYHCEKHTFSVVTDGSVTTLCSYCKHVTCPEMDYGRLTAFCVDCGAEHYVGSDERPDSDFVGGIRCNRCSVVFRDKDAE